VSTKRRLREPVEPVEPASLPRPALHARPPPHLRAPKPPHRAGEVRPTREHGYSRPGDCEPLGHVSGDHEFRPSVHTHTVRLTSSNDRGTRGGRRECSGRHPAACRFNHRRSTSARKRATDAPSLLCPEGCLASTRQEVTVRRRGSRTRGSLWQPIRRGASALRCVFLPGSWQVCARGRGSAGFESRDHGIAERRGSCCVRWRRECRSFH
jgi:hypothetical protein